MASSSVLDPRLPPAWQEGAGAASGTDALLRALLCVFIATLVAEGPLRWLAALSGGANLLYLRDAIPVGSLAVLVLRPLLQRRWLDMPVLLAAGALAAHALVGLMLGLAPFQVALGLKTFVYVLYGMAMWPLLQDRWDAVLRAAVVVYAVTLAGLVLNFFAGPLPWEGLEYDTAFGAVATTWRWWMGGIPRLPGFARVSFNAAMLLGLSGVLVMVRVRAPWGRIAVALVTLAGILVTTSKGMLLAFPIAAAWLLVPAGEGHARVGRWMVQGLCALGLALPAAALLCDFAGGLSPDGWPSVLESAWERFSLIWPQAFDLLPPGVAGLLGGGLGAIGTPQMFGYHPHLFHPADSLAVYLLVDFGLAGALYYVVPALTLRGAAAGSQEQVGRVYAALLMVAYGYGTSISMLEETFFATTLGLALGAALRGMATARRPS